MTKRVDLTGQRFGRLLVQHPAANLGRNTAWLCLCDCGSTKAVATMHLRAEFTQSCGCMGRERRVERNTTHGQARRGGTTLEYTMWCAAKGRSKRNGWQFSIELEDIVVPEVCPVLGIRLGGGTRGNHAYSPSLDRIDPNKGYIPGNVWVISHRANMIKSDATLQELRLLVRSLEAQNG